MSDKLGENSQQTCWGKLLRKIGSPTTDVRTFFGKILGGILFTTETAIRGTQIRNNFLFLPTHLRLLCPSNPLSFTEQLWFPFFFTSSHFQENNLLINHSSAKIKGIFVLCSHRRSTATFDSLSFSNLFLDYSSNPLRGYPFRRLNE